ncbi:hypothetical protein JOL79_11155 [Microbispora sp. RL4-1S]|uniref:DUF3761 domain-containing protein n=1 Tax=Microbispora oryzae TaxID=2806554 RepID=A0A940WMW9_9ACTN|nr:hypothetical protein [Microbispora oryzae]MBP2704370.1 hypothetical protein [Microbispora oryzae]
MLRRLLVSGALVASALVAPVALAAGPADAAATHTTVAASCYKRVGNHWTCITPGAYCPAAAHSRYGYAKVTKKRYRCSYYSSDGRWHWKRA